MVLKIGEVQLDPVCEKCRSITQREVRQEYAIHNKEKEG